MKRLALVLMLLMLPSMAWANTSVLECSADTGVVEGNRIIETFAWGGQHTTWSATYGLIIHEDWQVESFTFWPYGIKVKLNHVETRYTKEIIFNNGWICRHVWMEEND